ncbi:MAG: DUF1844 domain-containing protein [Thermoanaerobaculia bacterium]|nr:DUF1844 domain-containing protein [Thermoanaerobaculia bacterium]
MSKEIKVTDKRIFTPEGDLKEEYKHLEDEEAAPPEDSTPEREEPAPESPIAPPGAEPRVPEGPETTSPPPGSGAPSPGPEAPGRSFEVGEDEEAGESPGFFDLVAMIAEPVALYLGDAKLPDGRSAENLEMARLHIDLLEVLKEKTAGNLSAQESTALEDLLYRLRMRYVQKRG